MADEAAPRVFLRQASGFVKAASTVDVLIFNTGLISIGIGVLYTHLIGPASYPNGDIGVASLIATLAMLGVGLGMWAWSVTVPRSGAVYVYVSRGSHPALGFALSFVDATCWLFYNAVAAVLFAKAGLAPLFVGLYLINGDQKWLTAAEFLNRPIVAAACGTALILFCGAVLVFGMRRFFTFQRVMMLVAAIGTIALLWCLAAHTQEDLKLNLAQLLKGRQSYNGLINEAQARGLTIASQHNWSESLRLSVWPFLPLIGGAFSIAIGGEIRNVFRGQAVGILGSISVCGALFALIGWLSYAGLGADFQAAVAFLDATHDPARLPVTPYMSILIALLSNNVWLTLVICVGFIAWIYFWIPGMLAYAERVMVAWSLDRAAPARWADVEAGTPRVAIAWTVAVSIALTWLYACTPFFNTLIFIEAATWTWLITAIVGIFFPYSRPRLYSLSPIANRQILGLPLLSAFNALSALALIGMGLLLWADPIAAGHSSKSLLTIAGTFLVGAIFYYAMRIYRLRSEGIDIAEAYREIPVE
jgi:basic amino acid/polyamine antiporter, APA family